MRASLTILGLYNYDTSIFENLTLPNELDAATAIDSIIFDNAELEIMYPEPSTMKFLIGLWSSRESPLWERLYNAMQLEYNPIENYNRTETWTDSETEENTNTGSETGTGNETDSETTSVSSSDTNNRTSSGNSSNTHKVVGYNDTAFTNANSDTATSSETIGDTATGTGSGSRENEKENSHSLSKSETGEREKTASHSGQVSGNIGVTTSQQMLQQELDIVPKLEIYKVISESFKKRFCLMVY